MARISTMPGKIQFQLTTKRNWQLTIPSLRSTLKYSQITPNLKKLHWLHVKYRIQFKIGLITYKILNQSRPVYLRELIIPYTSSRNTRRSTPKLKFLHTPTSDCKIHKSVKLFSNSFSHYAQVLWNSLPF